MSDAPLSRRRLMGAGLLLVAGGAGGWRLLRREAAEVVPAEEVPQVAVEAAEPGSTFTPELEAIRGQVLAALPFLIVPRETVDAFLSALSKVKRKPRKADDAVRLFLLSTDFFAHGADESRPLAYAQLYDPYRNPCYDPMEPA